MHSAGETLLVRHTLKQISKLALLDFTQRRQKVRLMLTCNAAYIAEYRTTPFGQTESITAAIAWILAPLNEATALKLIDKRDQSARYHPKHSRQRLLRNRGGRAQNAKHACMCREQTQLVKAFREPGCRMGANLGKKKSGARTALGARTLRVVSGFLRFHMRQDYYCIL